MFAGLVLVLNIAIKLDEDACLLVFPGLSVILYGYSKGKYLLIEE